MRNRKEAHEPRTAKIVTILLTLGGMVAIPAAAADDPVECILAYGVENCLGVLMSHQPCPPVPIAGEGAFSFVVATVGRDPPLSDLYYAATWTGSILRQNVSYDERTVCEAVATSCTVTVTGGGTIKMSSIPSNTVTGDWHGLALLGNSWSCNSDDVSFSETNAALVLWITGASKPGSITDIITE